MPVPRGLGGQPSPYRNFFSGRLATTLQGLGAKFMQEEMGTT